MERLNEQVRRDEEIRKSKKDEKRLWNSERCE